MRFSQFFERIIKHLLQRAQIVLFKRFIYLLLLCLLASLVVTYRTLDTPGSNSFGPDPSLVIALVLLDSTLLLALTLFLLRNKLRTFINKRIKSGKSKIQDRIINTFCIAAITPTVLLSIFSISFFNFGLKSWFDHRINSVLTNSLHIAESYIEENKLNLRNTTWTLADDLSNMYYELIHNSELFYEVLNAQAQIRGISEAIVFQRETNSVLAQTALSFSLSFVNIPIHLIEKARNGEIVEVNNAPDKLRMLVKLREYEDTYLLVGKLMDPDIINYLSQANGAAAEYLKLQNEQHALQMQFSITFIIIILLLLVITLAAGIIFTSSLLQPINSLVSATDEVQKGNFAVQVTESSSNDELQILVRAFNHMVTKLAQQQDDLVLAQRALAWSDVARRVAHEIKNPLTPIQLAADRLLSKFGKDLPPDLYNIFNRYIQTILRHARDINKIVSEFIYFAKMPSPILHAEDIVSIVYELVASRRLLNDKVIYKFHSVEDSIIFPCDVTQMNQVVVNLLKNAEEAFSEFTVDPQISIDISHSQEAIIMTIEDNGPGFPTEMLKQSTEAYVTTRATGMGLGLAIVKKIVQDHHGTLFINNLQPVGARITITFKI